MLRGHPLLQFHVRSSLLVEDIHSKGYSHFKEGGKSFSILRSDFVCLKSSTIGLFPHSSFWASTSVLGTLIKRSREAHRSCFQPVLPGKTSLTHTISSPPSRLAIPNVAFLTSEGFSPSVQPDSISGNEVALD
ncbi:hypothetical protein V6N11_014102 [Hibiscus sabdariffa]|uniref:Uncharacterized protein n=1 Tax=Hibiscus sabdariffa TaxID=183260 RepID=A0ABR2AG71_9ROSI